jgi:Carboxypeptidase regulatory-like domain
MQSAITRYDRQHKTTTHLPLFLKFPLALSVRVGLAMLMLLVLLAPRPVAAQSGAGSIQGTVEDTTGAIIPGCKVQIVNVAKGTTIDSVANSSGFYSVPGLFTGQYTVTFSAPGMKQYQIAISLQDAQNAVINPQLPPGAVTEKITISADAVQLATYDSGTIATEIDSNRIDQLPMNGRMVLALTGDTVPGLEAGGTRANGNMAEALEYTQDGAPLTNRNFGGETNSTQAQLPDPDAVQEVRVETVTSNAQFATPATAILTTKSGTNSFHGSLFETARNNVIGSAKPRGTPNFVPPHLVRNEFGASVGGPIIIPHLYDGKDKSFFFFAFERFSLGQSTPEAAFVPTVAMRNGDFSGLVNSSGNLQQLYDPNTSNGTTYQRQPFANNQIPIGRISPLAKALYAASPLPNNSANPLVASNITIPALTQTVIPNTTFRLDQVVNENNRFYLRFTDINQSTLGLRNYPSNTPPTLAAGGLPAQAEGYQVIPVTTISAALGFTHVFSPTFTSETIYAQQWFRQYVAGTTQNTNIESILGLPNNFGEVGFPTIGGGNSPLLMPYGGTQYNYGENQIEFNLDENLTKILGKHQLQFGVRYRRERIAYLPDRLADSVPFSNLGTAEINSSTIGSSYSALPNTGYQDADFFLGAADSYSVNLNPTLQHFTDYEIDSYVQDNYHVNAHLTFNVGLRWEVHPSPITRDGTLVSFDLARDAVVLANPLSYYINKGYTTQAVVNNYANVGVNFETPQTAGIPSSMLYGNNEFNPRIGFAYQPFTTGRGTVIRGAYGRYIYPIPIRNSLKIPAAAPPFSATYSESYTVANQSPDGLPNYLLRAPQSIIAGSNSSGVVNSSTSNSILPGVNFSTLAPHYAPAAVTQVNLTVEQPLKGGSVLRATYLLDHGSNLDQNFQYNNHPSNYVYETLNGVAPPTGQYAATATGPYDQKVYGGNVESVKTGWSNDNALQLNYQRPFKGGYAYQIFYVYSRAFRVGGNTFRDSSLYPAANYIPSTLGSIDPGTLLNPSHALNRLENYKIDTAIPEHHISFNGIVDLPVGRGKRLLGNSNRLLDELVGGYQIAFVGNVLSQSFQPASSNWGATNPLKVYKHGAPITDCRSGVCYKENLWFNGFLSPSVINASVKGVSGVPSGYLPYLSPINVAANNNNVSVPLKNGTTDTQPYSPGPAGVNRFSKTVLLGPYNYNADISLFKVFPIKNQLALRINVDAFNAFNIQGNVNPNTTDGTENLQTPGANYWTPRQIQLTARLSF